MITARATSDHSTNHARSFTSAASRTATAFSDASWSSSRDHGQQNDAKLIEAGAIHKTTREIVYGSFAHECEGFVIDREAFAFRW